MKKAFLIITCLLCTTLTWAQRVVETFDGNSLNWSECVFDNEENIKYIVSDGYLTVHSERNTDFNWATGNSTVSLSTAISTCYAPIDMEKPFKIKTHLVYDDEDYPFAVLFNLKDDGTYYCLEFIEATKKVYFARYEDNKYVGGWTQGFPYPKLKKGEQLEIVITSDCQTLSCEVQGIPIFDLRYVSFQYQGFGFMTHGNQEIKVDDVEFIQM